MLHRQLLGKELLDRQLLLADYIAGNTCNHYAWAASRIREWEKPKIKEGG